MIAKDCTRKAGSVLCALTILGATGSSVAWSQTSKGTAKAAKAPLNQEAAATVDQGKALLGKSPLPKLEPTAIPVNPSDPIAIVNGEVITRQRLADEVVARKGEEILETLISRTLIQQAMSKAKLQVTAGEIDEEIDNVARRMGGIGRDAWLKTLDKERGISPMQYAKDIIYPALALRKLAAPRVQVTQKDLQDAFEARYGDKLRCRIIMVDKERAAIECWEELRKNPGGFEKLAMERSMDSGSRSIGGLLAEPISRHAYPQHVSDNAFHQLVDGDPADKDPKHKPKDGDFTGPIQVAEATWILLRREGVIPAQNVDLKNEAVRKDVYDMIYEVKLKEAMNLYMNDLMNQAAVDNKLTGHVKFAGEAINLDADLQQAAASRPTVKDAAGAAAKQKTPTPAGLSREALQQSESLNLNSAKTKK